jgi:hypothetical protein
MEISMEMYNGQKTDQGKKRERERGERVKLKKISEDI